MGAMDASGRPVRPVLPTLAFDVHSGHIEITEPARVAGFVLSYPPEHHGVSLQSKHVHATIMRKKPS